MLFYCCIFEQLLHSLISYFHFFKIYCYWHYKNTSSQSKIIYWLAKWPRLLSTRLFLYRYSILSFASNEKTVQNANRKISSKETPVQCGVKGVYYGVKVCLIFVTVQLLRVLNKKYCRRSISRNLSSPNNKGKLLCHKYPRCGSNVLKERGRVNSKQRFCIAD